MAATLAPSNETTKIRAWAIEPGDVFVSHVKGARVLDKTEDKPGRPGRMVRFQTTDGIFFLALNEFATIEGNKEWGME